MIPTDFEHIVRAPEGQGATSAVVMCAVSKIDTYKQEPQVLFLVDGEYKKRDQIRGWAYAFGSGATGQQDALDEQRFIVDTPGNLRYKQVFVKGIPKGAPKEKVKQWAFQYGDICKVIQEGSVFVLFWFWNFLNSVCRSV